MPRLFLLLALACGQAKTPAQTLAATASGPDAAELLAAAQSVTQGAPGAEARWARACLRAGVRRACTEFAAGQPRLLAFLALSFGEPEPAQRLLADGEATVAARRDLALGIARHFRRGDSEESLLKARAALTLADKLDIGNERVVDRQLIGASLALASREFATATASLKKIVEDDAVIGVEQREELIRLGTLVGELAADTSKDATDQARKLFSEMNKQSPDEAVGDAEQLTQRHPQSSLAFMALGFARLKASDEPGAVAAWEKARSLCAFDPEPDYQLAMLHERRARHTRAVYFLQRGLETAPVWPKGLWLMTEVAIAAREPEQATKALKRLKRLFPDDVMVDLGLARTLLDRDEGARALALLKDAAREHPADLRPALALARAAMTLHSRAQTVSERERMVGEADRALESAEKVAKDSEELTALKTAVEKLHK